MHIKYRITPNLLIINSQRSPIMNNPIYTFIHEDQGATAAEYAIMASAIALAVIAVVFALGSTTAGLFNSFHTEYNKVDRP